MAKFKFDGIPFHPVTGEAQDCRPIGTNLVCNFVVRNGYVIYSDKGKNIPIPLFGGNRKKMTNQEVIGKKIE